MALYLDQVILFNSTHATKYLAVDNAFYYFFFPSDYDFSTCVAVCGTPVCVGGGRLPPSSKQPASPSPTPSPRPMYFLCTHLLPCHTHTPLNDLT
jgi:hypothetical protein